MSLTDSAFSPTVQILLTMSIAVLIWLGLSSDIVTALSPGLFVTYLIAAGAIGKPLRQLTQVLNIVQKALAAAQDIFEQLDSPKEPELGTEVLNDVKGQITFDNVSFTYPGQDLPTLKNISFTINPGEMVALVGGSGGGKSTIASLVPRFYNVEQGQVLIDGQPISQFTLASVRKQIALVSQQVVLLNDSIFNNIAYGQMRSASRADVIKAAERANARGFIEQMEHGFETQVGDNGLRLSGGQRQRIAIARAILNNAPILVLDEATSALDNESERVVQASMMDMAKGRSTLVIAHRLSTIERADKILVLDKGEIVEQGTHSELLAKNGYYAELHHDTFQSDKLK